MLAYTDKKTKIMVISIFLVIFIIILSCLISFHAVFHYTPGKTEFSVVTSRENFLDKSSVALSGNLLTYSSSKKYTTDGIKRGTEKSIELTDAEVREVFRYIIKNKMYFLIIRKFDKHINVMWEELVDDMNISELPTDYFITVRYNDFEKKLGGTAAIGYWKMSDMITYMNGLAEDKLGSLSY